MKYNPTLHKLSNGVTVILESAKNRCDKLLGEYCLTGALYDFYKRVEICRTMTAYDVRQLTADFWKSPISITTCGLKFDANLVEIWNNNFPGTHCGHIVQQKQKEGR